MSVCKISTLTNFVLIFSIDATSEPKKGPRLARLVNHENKKPNCFMRVIEVCNRPYLALFALRDIYPDEELGYDYGPKDLPWEIQVT